MWEAMERGFLLLIGHVDLVYYKFDGNVVMISFHVVVRSFNVNLLKILLTKIPFEKIGQYASRQFLLKFCFVRSTIGVSLFCSDGNDFMIHLTASENYMDF